MRKCQAGAQLSQRPRTPTWPVSALKPRCLPITHKELHQLLKTSWSPASPVTELCSPPPPRTPASSVDPATTWVAEPWARFSTRGSCSKTSEMNQLQTFHNQAHFPDTEVEGSGLALSRSDGHWLLGAEGLACHRLSPRGLSQPHSLLAPHSTASTGPLIAPQPRPNHDHDSVPSPGSMTQPSAVCAAFTCVRVPLWVAPAHSPARAPPPRSLLRSVRRPRADLGLSSQTARPQGSQDTGRTQ